MGTASEFILQGKDLGKSYFTNDRETVVFKGINAAFRKGKVTVVTGRSGVGKSTLLNLLGGLDLPTSGRVVFEDLELNALSNAELADLRSRKIGIIFQSFNLLSSWTAFENVEAALLHTDLDEPAQREKILSLLSRLGLGDRLDNLPAELSVGQQQRVAIARTLINEPALILADEPTGDVDPETAQEILGHLLEAVRNRGASLIVATHGSFPLNHADEVYRLENGGLTRQS